MFTLPAFTWTLGWHLAWIIVVTIIFCILSINLMRRRLIV
jgi:lipooligosaccharide transport system permease protein